MAIYLKQSSENFHVIIRSNINHEVSTTMNEYISMIGELFVDDPRFALHFTPIGNLKENRILISIYVIVKNYFLL